MATPGADGRDGRERPSRMWWAAPGALVAGSAIGLAVVIGPTLGQQVSVPRQLIVPATADTPTPGSTSTATPPSRRHRPRPQATPTPPPATVVAIPTTRVVQPRRPVVTASADDGYDRQDGSGEHQSGDG